MDALRKRWSLYAAITALALAIAVFGVVMAHHLSGSKASADIKLDPVSGSIIGGDGVPVSSGVGSTDPTVAPAASASTGAGAPAPSGAVPTAPVEEQILAGTADTPKAEDDKAFEAAQRREQDDLVTDSRRRFIINRNRKQRAAAKRKAAAQKQALAEAKAAAATPTPTATPTVIVVTVPATPTPAASTTPKTK